MAEADESRWGEQVARIAECLTCRDKVTNNRLLPCGHTFCHKCLDKYSKSNKDKSLPCPVCIPKNLSVERLLEATLDKEENKVPLCEACETENPAEVRCIQCDQNLCGVCGKLHQKLKIAMDHQVIPVTSTSQHGNIYDPQRYYCEYHPGNVLELLCKDCDTIICWKCLALQHSTHSIFKINEAVAGHLARLQSCIVETNERLSTLKKCSENIKDQMKQYLEYLEKETCNVVKVEEDLVRIIATNKNEMLKQMNTTLTCFRNSSQQHERLIDSQTQELRKHKTSLEQLKASRNGWVISSRSEELYKKSKELMSAKIPKIDAPILLSMSDAAIQHQLIPKTLVGRFHSLPIHQQKWVQDLGIPPNEKDNDIKQSKEQGFQSYEEETCTSLEVKRLTAEVLNTISLGYDFAVIAVAVSKQKIFVAFERVPHIIVYRAVTLRENS